MNSSTCIPGKDFVTLSSFLFDANEKNASKGEADEACIAKLRKYVIYICGD